MKGKGKRLRLTAMEKEFVSHKIQLLRREGKSEKQAAGEAYGMVRQTRKKGRKAHA